MSWGDGRQCIQGDTPCDCFGPPCGALGEPPKPTASLSPSRAGDFMRCPQLYKYRAIDKLPEPQSAAAARGTLVHAVLEWLYEQPRPARTLQAAWARLPTAWAALHAADPALATLFDNDADWRTWQLECTAALERYFTLEDPARLEPATREEHVETILPGGLRLHGYIDRVDIAGELVRVVDYKTGKKPSPRYQDQALFQMRFYALVLWRLRGVVPTRLQLIYLGNPAGLLTYDPTAQDLTDTELQLRELWGQIEYAKATDSWPPRPQRLCDWCHFKPICPAHTQEGNRP